jgi:hypothetical protein
MAAAAGAVVVEEGAVLAPVIGDAVEAAAPEIEATASEAAEAAAKAAANAAPAFKKAAGTFYEESKNAVRDAAGQMRDAAIASAVTSATTVINNTVAKATGTAPPPPAAAGGGAELTDAEGGAVEARIAHRDEKGQFVSKTTHDKNQRLVFLGDIKASITKGVVGKGEASSAAPKLSQTGGARPATKIGGGDLQRQSSPYRIHIAWLIVLVLVLIAAYYANTRQRYALLVGGATLGFVAYALKRCDIYSAV